MKRSTVIEKMMECYNRTSPEDFYDEVFKFEADRAAALLDVDGVIFGEAFTNYEGKRYIRGFIYIDRKQRFDDGEFIVTSLLVKEPDDGSMVYETTYSKYYLVNIRNL